MIAFSDIKSVSGNRYGLLLVLLISQTIFAANYFGSDSSLSSAKHDQKSITISDFGASPFVGATENVKAFQATLDYANKLGGAKVYIPNGIYALNGSISIPANTLLQGEGRRVSVLKFTHVGDGIKSTWPLNSSTGATVGLRDLGIVNTNSENMGGGFIDVGGTFVDLFNVYLSGWKYQIIFDQTEIASIDASEVIQESPGQTGVWLVNGADYSTGARQGFTNRITISRSQFNANKLASYNILDDGGGAHSIRDNNFNAGYGGIRAAGVGGLNFEGNESEGHVVSMLLTDKTSTGTYVGFCLAPIVEGNTFSDSTDVHILVDGASGGSIAKNVFAQALLANVSFAGEAEVKATGMVIEGNSKLIRGKYKQGAPFVRGGQSVFKANQVRQVAVTYGTSVNETLKVVEVRPGSMEGIYHGSQLLVVNEDGSNGETVVVTSTTQTSFTAIFQMKKANGYSIFGMMPIYSSSEIQ